MRQNGTKNDLEEKFIRLVRNFLSSDDEPAFYNSFLTLNLEVDINESVKSLVTKVINTEKTIYHKIFSIAAQNQVNAIDDQLEKIKE